MKLGESWFFAKVKGCILFFIGLATGDGILELVEEVEEAVDLVEDESSEQEEVVEKLKVGDAETMTRALEEAVDLIGVVVR